MGLRSTRRELIRRGLTGAGGALAAGAIRDPTTALAAPQDGEARALIHALRIEQVLVISYQRVLGSGLLTPSVKPQLETLLGQELHHVTLLGRALAAGGATAPPAPSLPDAQSFLSRHDVHWSLTRLQNQHDCLKLLVDVESLAENAYFVAVGEVAEAGLLRTCAAILASEAQHWTVLSGLLNHQDAKKAVPYPFVEGTP